VKLITEDICERRPDLCRNAEYRNRSSCPGQSLCGPARSRLTEPGRTGPGFRLDHCACVWWIGLPRVLKYSSTTRVVNYSSNVLLLEYSLISISGCKFSFPFAVSCTQMTVSPHQCNVSPLQGEKPQNRPLGYLNTGALHFAQCCR